MASDLTGRRFGRLTAIEKSAEKIDKYALWKCVCDCGGECMATSRQLTRGTVTDCGCVARETDLTGRTFGSLTAVKRLSDREYLCRCVCGNEISVMASDLERGHTKSCGCMKRAPRGQDVTGMRSGKLVAIEPSGQMGRGGMLWKCRCDCGNEFLAEGWRIAAGRVASCGCSRIGKGVKDLAGQRFGSLVALERLNEKSGSCYLWRCVCDCGQEINVPASRLISGNTRSCGHLQDPRRHLTYIDGTCVEMVGRTALRSNNTSGYTGVTEVKGFWRAMITFKGISYYLGTYRTVEEAALARKLAEERLFGEFLEWYYEEFLPRREQEEEIIRREAGM